MVLNRMLLSIVVVGMFCSAAFALVPMGPPMAGLPQGGYSVGVGYAFSDMNLEVSGPVSGGGEAVINDIQNDMYYLCLGYGISDDWTLYGGIGAVNAEFTADGAGNDFEGDTGFAFGIGTKRTLAENGDTKWGVLAQFTQGKSEDTITSVSGQSFGNGSIGGATFTPAGSRHPMKIEWYEIQVALGPTVPISEDVCVYGGPFLHFVEGDLEVKDSRAEWELEQRLQLGAYIGTLVNIGNVGSLNDVSVMAELLWTGEAWGVGIGAMIKFP